MSDHQQEAERLAMWYCPICLHIMNECQSKHYAGCPTDKQGIIVMHLAQHTRLDLATLLAVQAELESIRTNLQQANDERDSAKYELEKFKNCFVDWVPTEPSELRIMQIWSNCLGNLVYQKAHWIDALGKTTRLLNEDKVKAQQERDTVKAELEKFKSLAHPTNERKAVVVALQDAEKLCTQLRAELAELQTKHENLAKYAHETWDKYSTTQADNADKERKLKLVGYYGDNGKEVQALLADNARLTRENAQFNTSLNEHVAASCVNAQELITLRKDNALLMEVAKQAQYAKVNIPVYVQYMDNALATARNAGIPL